MGCDRLRARRAVREGTSAYGTGDYRAAMEKFRAAVRLEPSLATAHLNLGMTALAVFSAAPRGAERDRAASEAITALQLYSGLRPTDPRPRAMLLSLWIDSGRYDEALGYFLARNERNPGDAETVKLLGVINSKAGRFDEALSWYRRRAGMSPEPEAQYAVGTLCWERLHDRPDIAGADRLAIADTGIDALMRATELRRDYAEAWTYLNLLYRERALGQASEEARRQDLQTADGLYRRALDIARTRGR